MIRRALTIALLLVLVAVPTAALARKGHPHAALGTVTVTVAPDPIVVDEPFTVTVTTDTYGWLREESPCVIGWVNVAPGESTVSLAAPCAGTVSLELTDTAGVTYAGPFTFTAEEAIP